MDAPEPPAGFCLASRRTSSRVSSRAGGRQVVFGQVLDQAQVPGERGAGRHDPVQAQVPGQQPRQGGDHCPVSPGPLRAGNLAAQDPRARVPRSPRPWRCCCARGALAKPNAPTISSQTRRKSTSAGGRGPAQMICTSSGTPQGLLPVALSRPGSLRTIPSAAYYPRSRVTAVTDAAATACPERNGHDCQG